MRFALNIDHVATLRNARGENQPDPITAALIAEQAGVDGIVFHLGKTEDTLTNAMFGCFGSCLRQNLISKWQRWLKL